MNRTLRWARWLAGYLIIGAFFAFGHIIYTDTYPSGLNGYERFIGTTISWPLLIVIDVGFETAKNADERRGANEARKEQ